jgi:hypothetical protein
MTDLDARLDAALADVYRARTSATASADVVARIASVPTSGRPDRPRWLRPGFALAGAAAALVVALATLDRLRALSAGGPPSSGALTVFDPVHPGAGLVALTGPTFTGISGVLLPTMFALLLAFAVWAVVSWVRGLGQPAAPKPAPKPLSRRELLRRIGWAAVLVASNLLLRTAFDHPALAAGMAADHGIGFAERRMDGIGSVTLYGERYLTNTGGPRDLYRVGPGEPLTYVVSIRNAWPVPVTIQGRWADATAVTDISAAAGATPTGLGLLRDPARRDGSVENTAPFSPVTLWPGEEVAIVVAEIGRPCADPSVQVPVRTNSAESSEPGARRLQPIEPALELVYSAFGIEGVSPVLLSPEVTVPSTCPH